MKKLASVFIIFLLCVVLCLQGVLGVAANSTRSTSMLGDVNSDGYVDNLDAAMILMYDAALIDFTVSQLALGDVNNDGGVDNLDAVLILLYDAGLNDSLGGDNNSSPDDSEDSSIASSEDSSADVSCSHPTTTVINRVDATIAADGYSGDVYCSACEQIIQNGIVLDKFVVEAPVRYVTYTNSVGNQITLPVGVDVLDYTLKRANKQAVSAYPEVEAEIFNLINQERVKAGLDPLVNLPLAYYFSNLRANECFEAFSHTRPNNTAWYTVFDGEDVFYRGAGENLVYSMGRDISVVAAFDVEAWMNSEGHKANILNPDFTATTIAVVYLPETRTHYAVQLFFK